VSCLIKPVCILPCASCRVRLYPCHAVRSSKHPQAIATLLQQGIHDVMLQPLHHTRSHMLA
jgi:hypothetical protein